MRKILLTGVVTLEVIVSGTASAQEAPPPPSAQSTEAPATSTLNQVVITATKREQTLQDVPISVSVTSQATLEKAHIVDLLDLQSVVPSFKAQQLNAVGQTNFIIRGFGNGAGNDGIESSVGVFVDGVYRSRTSSALDDLPEIERIEVLRGPQSTLFGKNVSAGAINIVTARPQFLFGGTGSIDFGNYNLKQQRVSITGPLSESVAVRISASNDERDGYLINDTTGNDVNNRSRQSVRADVLWNASKAVTLRVIADYNHIREVCCGVVPLLNGPATQFIGAPAPGGLGRSIGDPANKFNNHFSFNTDPTNRLVGQGVSAQLDWKTDVGTLTSITASRRQTNESVQDVDFTGADLANKNQANGISTFSQELRMTGRNGPAHWLVGGYYQRENLDTGVDTSFGTDIRRFGDGLSGTVATGPLAGRSNLFALEYLQGLVTPSITAGSTYFAPGQGISDHYKMKSDSYSIFGNVDFDVTDNLTLTGGLAYLSDRKRAQSNVVLTDAFSALNLQNVPQLPFVGVPANTFAGLNPLQFFYGNTQNHAPVNFPNAAESGELKGDKLTTALRAAYDFGVANAYVSYSTGWKAGAFNLSSDSRPPNANGVGRTAGPENVSLIEVGVKSAFKDGFVTLAVFDQTIKGFQSNAYTGTGYALVNAGKESTRGIELDAAYRPAKWLALTGAATYLDPKYDSFKQAPCVAFDTLRCPIDPVTGAIPASRDLSGQRPSDIARWTLSTSATLTQELGKGYSAYLRGEYNYTTQTSLGMEQVPPSIGTYGQQAVNASIGLSSRPQHYEVMLWARNLTDHREVIGVFPTVAQAGSYSGFPNQPRTFGVTLRTRF